MIFRGHLLDDEKLITDNKIENEDVVHLVARMESNANNNNNNTSNNNINNSEENRNNSDIGFFPSFFRVAPPPFFPFPYFRDNRWESSNYRIISSTQTNNRRNSEFAPQPTINSDEIRETIAQNILEVQNLIDYGNYDEFKETQISKKEKENINMKENTEKKEEMFDMNCFNLDKRILAKGQWVDVKDTVEQWLDAQVMEVSEDNKMVKIHYNHWSTRWDEWIYTNSPRIMPFRYHTRQVTLTNYNSPFPNKKPDIGVTLLSFENINREGCVHPLSLSRQRNRSNSNNGNNSNNSNNTNTNNINNNSNSNNASDNTVPIISNESPNSTNANNTNQNYLSINISRRRRSSRYAEPPPPIPSPKHQEPDPDNHLLKNLGTDGFLGVFNEFNKINKTIEGLSSSLLLEHNNNTEILTPKKLSEIQTKSYYDLKRLIPLLDRTGRIYSDISAFFEHSIKTNQMELISKNIFTDVGRINEDLKYFSAEERRRISREILEQNSRRENRSGTVNFVPPVNNFDTKLKNYLPILDTPVMIGKSDPQISPVLDVFIQNNNEEDMSSNEDNHSNNENNNINNTNNTNNINNMNNNFLRNIQVENFNIEYNKEKENKKEINNNKILGLKTKRKKEQRNSKNKNNDNGDCDDNDSEIDDYKKNKKKK